MRFSRDTSFLPANRNRVKAWINFKSLSKDCWFTAVTAEKQRDDSIRDAFISGLVSGGIRQNLLEKDILDLQTAFDTARSLEMAEKQNHTFNPINIYVAAENEEASSLGDNSTTASTYNSNSNKCYFCGNNRHLRAKCPAKEVTCSNCDKKNILQKIAYKKTSLEIYTAVDSTQFQLCHSLLHDFTLTSHGGYGFLS